MKKIKKVAILFSLLSLLVSFYIPWVFAATYRFSMATRINDIYADGRNIWVATDNGVYRLGESGYVIQNIDSSYGLPDGYVKRVVVDSSGRVYALTYYGLSLIYPPKGVSQVFSTLEGMPQGVYNALNVSDRYIAVSVSEKVWIRTKKDDESFVVNVGSYVNDVQLVGDSVWIASYNGLYVYSTAGKFKKKVLSGKVNDLYRYGSSIYVAAKDNLYIINVADYSVTRKDVSLAGELSRVVVTTQGDIVVASRNNLAIFPHNGNFYKLTIGNTTDVITAMYPWKDGNVLVALSGTRNGGLYMLENLFYVQKLWGVSTEVRNNIVSYVKPENTALVWFKYGESIYWFHSPNRFYKFNFISSDGKPIDSSIIISIAPWITGDKLALGTVLGFYVGNKVSRVMTQVDISSFIGESIVDVDTNGKGEYYILTRRYLYIYNAYSGYFKRVSLPYGQYAYDECFYDGSLYVATSKAVLKYMNGNVIASYSIPAGATKIVGTLGGVWAITDGNLVFLDRHIHIKIPIALFDRVDVVDVDRWGKYLVVATTDGVFFYRKGQIWGMYSAFEGHIVSNYITDVAVWQNYLVVGTRSGLSVVDLTKTPIDFQDIRDIETIEWLHRLTSLNIVKGTGDGRYLPYKPITVEGLVILLSRAMDIPTNHCNVENAHIWAIPYICGYFKGDVPDGVNWKEPLTPAVWSKYFSFVGIKERHGIYYRIEVFRFIYNLIYASGLWR